MHSGLDADLADLACSERAADVILDVWRERHPRWRALQKDVRWQELEHRATQLLSEKSRADVVEPSTTAPPLAELPGLVELRLEVASLAQEYDAPMFDRPNVCSLLRLAAQRVDRFVEYLALYFEQGDGSYRGLPDSSLSNHPSDAATETPHQLWHASELIDGAFKLMVLRDNEGNELPANRVEVWTSGTWTASRYWRTTAEELLPLARTIAERRVSYAVTIEQPNWGRALVIPATAAPLAIAWASCLHRLAASPTNADLKSPWVRNPANPQPAEAPLKALNGKPGLQQSERHVPAGSMRVLPGQTNSTGDQSAGVIPDPWRDLTRTVDERVRQYMLHLRKYGRSKRPTCRQLAQIVNASDTAVSDTASWKDWRKVMITGKHAEEKSVDRHTQSAVKEANDRHHKGQD